MLLFIKKWEQSLEEKELVIRILGNCLVVLMPRYGVEGVVHECEKDATEIDEQVE